MVGRELVDSREEGEIVIIVRVLRVMKDRLRATTSFPCIDGPRAT